MLGPEYAVRGRTIIAGLPAVHGCAVPVPLHVALAGIGEHFVPLRCPVMRARGMKAHQRSALDRLNRAYVRHPGERRRLRDLLRGRAHAPALVEAGRAGTGRQLGIPLVQIADSRAKFSRSPPPAGHALTRHVSAFHLLVVSQPGVFRKGRRSRRARLELALACGQVARKTVRSPANAGSMATWAADRPMPGGGETWHGPGPPGSATGTDPGRHQPTATRTPVWHRPGTRAGRAKPPAGSSTAVTG